jgi:NADPH:quinone reductase-like Zn-dependent oxidoreductase
MIPKSMKACMLTGVNQFAVREIPVPTPGPFEVLCRIKAIAICGTDPEIVKGTHLNRNWPPEFPFVLGHEWSGEIVKLGEGVSGFKVGDRVAGEAHKGLAAKNVVMVGRHINDPAFAETLATRINTLVTQANTLKKREIQYHEPQR